VPRTKQNANGMKGEASKTHAGRVAKSTAEKGEPADQSTSGARIGYWSPIERPKDVTDLQKAEWLKKLTRQLARTDEIEAAWRTVKESGCDETLFKDLMYLFTYRGTLTIEEHQESHRQLAFEIDKLLPAYLKLREDLSTFVQHLRSSSAMNHPVLRGMLPDFFDKQLQQASQAIEKLRFERGESLTMGSTKENPNPRDYYLYCMAVMLRKESVLRFRYLPQLSVVIEAARAAHGEKVPVFSEATVKARIYRFMRRMQLTKSAMGKLTSSDFNPLMFIDPF
jgi:hypothetical protein